MLAFILDAFEEVKGGRTTTTKATKEEEIILHLHPCLAPIKVAVLPLVRKLQKPAQQVYQEIRKQFWAEYDEDGSIGRRYRRQDEIGTPFCVTIDFQTLDDQTVTIRDRDTMKQERVAIKQLSQVLSQKLG
jgi:glycyl-tRNA synthetase